MNKTLNNNQIAIDKSNNLVYNADITNNNNKGKTIMTTIITTIAIVQVFALLGAQIYFFNILKK